MKKALFTT